MVFKMQDVKTSLQFKVLFRRLSQVLCNALNHARFKAKSCVDPKTASLESRDNHSLVV